MACLGARMVMGLLPNAVVLRTGPGGEGSGSVSVLMRRRRRKKLG